MLDLFKAALFRYRIWALAYFLVHIGLIAFYTHAIDLLQLPPLAVKGLALAYGLSGLLLGLYQMGSYRQPNRWLTLIHRPVDPRRIAGALVGAASLLIAVGVALPIIMLLVVQESFTARVVDMRHWMLPMAAFLISLSGYLAAAYSVLGVRRYAPLVLFLPILLGLSYAVGPGAIAVQILVVLWLGFLVATAFKPALMQVPNRPVDLVATTIPVMLGIYYLLTEVGSLLFHVGWIMIGTHPLAGVAPKGGYVEASRAQSADLMIAGLEGRRDPQAQLWREQIRLSDGFKIQRGFGKLPVRGEMTNDVPISFKDNKKNIEWTFSHDTMRFEGRNLLNGLHQGSLGLGGRARFQGVPVSLGEGRMVAGNSIALFVPELGKILPRLTVPTGETIAAGPVPVGDRLALLTDKALIFYDDEALEFGDRQFPAGQRVPLVGRIGDLGRIDLIELLDGYLIAQTYGQIFGPGDSGAHPDAVQYLMIVDGSGRTAPVARRILKEDFPPFVRFQALWLSPVLHGSYEGARHLFAPRTPLQDSNPSSIPTSIWLLALALNIASLAGTYWWSARLQIGRARRFGWAIVSAIVGLPAFIAFCLFYPRQTFKG